VNPIHYIEKSKKEATSILLTNWILEIFRQCGIFCFSFLYIL